MQIDGRRNRRFSFTWDSTPQERLAMCTKLNEETGCHEWQGTMTYNGYGRLTYKKYRTVAHRFAYELKYGPVPEGHQLDHLCRNRCCVNPDHLEPVLPVENTRRGESVTSRNMKKMKCANGHPFDLFNTYMRKDGGRACRECHRLSGIKRRARARLLQPG